jgi:Mrp family chromosome partitioning ATPase
LTHLFSKDLSRSHKAVRIRNAKGGNTFMSSEKRVILSMGGKGGVGKTSIMSGLAEWFDSNQIPVQLLDLDT